MVGEDGNAFSILGRVKRIMRQNGLSDSEWQAFQTEATSGDYDNLLRTVMRWFSVDENLSDDYEDEDDDDEYRPNACYECDNPYAVGGCPECGAWHE